MSRTQMEKQAGSKPTVGLCSPRVPLHKDTGDVGGHVSDSSLDRLKEYC